jgi:hypothetical protein
MPPVVKSVFAPIDRAAEFRSAGRERTYNTPFTRDAKEKPPLGKMRSIDGGEHFINASFISLMKMWGRRRAAKAPVASTAIHPVSIISIRYPSGSLTKQMRWPSMRPPGR